MSMFPSVHNSEHLITTGNYEGGPDIADFAAPKLMNTFIIWDTGWYTRYIAQHLKVNAL